MLVRSDEQAQGMVEFALIIVLVSVAVIAVLTLFGPYVAGMYGEIVYAVSGETYAGGSEHGLEPAPETPTTPPPTPGPVSVTSPVEGQTVTGSVTFRWQHVAGATEYELWIDDGSSKLPTDPSVCNFGQCSRTLTLSPGAHKWRIRAINDGQNGSPSDWIHFTIAP